MGLTDRGDCMAVQIVVTVMGMKKVSAVGSRKGGSDARKRVLVQRFSPTQVEQQFDEVFAELYLCEAVSEERANVDLVEPQRDAPYKYEGWRAVGVTTRMCDAICSHCDWANIVT